VKTIQIHFKEGPVVQLSVSAQMLASMLVLRPDYTGITFRQQMQFAVVEGGERRMLNSSRIVVVEEA
jgi:hypothetical protein